MKRAIGLLLAGMVVLAASHASAQERAEPVPPELEGVGVTEHRNAAVPLELSFRDELDHTVKLGDYFQPGRPVLLTLNYYRCPMLCTLQLNGLVEALKALDWTPGRQFEIVTVSFDPLETAKLAEAKKQNYLGEYGRPGAGAGWHFLTGNKENIAALTGAVGFGYRWNEDRQQYVHVAAMIVCTPEGRISRYLYGVMFEPRTLRLTLAEASQGTIGSALDQVLLYCFHYDADRGRYAPAARRIMRVGGLATVLLLGGMLTMFWGRETRRRRAAVPREGNRAGP